MTIKFISLATGIVFLDVYLRSQLYSSDPLFLFASSNSLVNVGLLALIAVMVAVSFKDRFRRWWSFACCTAAAIILGVIGVIGLFFSDTWYPFPQILQPLDYMLLMEAGAVFGICSLSYRHARAPFKISWTQPAALLNNLAFPVPKALQSPHGNRSRGATA